MGNDLNAIREKVHKEIEEKILNTDEELSFTDEEIALTKLSAVKVREMLLNPNHRLKLSKLLQIFHFVKQKNMNSHFSLTDVFYFEPLIESIELEKKIINKKSKKDLLVELPLYGFVFSIKEYLRIKGTDSTWGYFDNVGIKSTFTAPILEFLKEKGALFTCKANVPQALMAMESTNEIYGTCQNPWNQERVAGGSSGGDAVNIALGLVNAAIGSDIGGSIRIPALFCGIYGLKPTVGRIDGNSHVEIYENHPFYGKNNDFQFVIGATIGPMASSAKDLTVMMKVLNDFNFISLDNPRLTWNNHPQKQTKIGFIPEMVSHLRLPDCCSRAFNEAKKVLTLAGFELVEVKIDHLIHKIAEKTYTSFFKDKLLMDLLCGDAEFMDMPIESYELTVRMFTAPIAALKNMTTSPIMSPKEQFMMSCFLKAQNTSESILKLAQKELIDQVHSEFEKVGVEVALAYGLFPAPIHFQTENLLYGAFYTCIWNFLNFPVGAVPVTTVREDEQFYNGDLNDKVEIELDKNMRESKGMPIGVQIVGLPWREELVLSVMEAFENTLSQNI